MSENTSLKHPVVVISLALILGVFALIGAAILDLDRGNVLSSMADSSFARGLITYLFGIVTIGTAIVIVVSVLTSEFTEANQKRFENAKDVLSLLLGVFGTIVGFYFGSEIGSQDDTKTAELSLTPPLLSAQLISGNQPVTVTAAVSGGDPPYQYTITIGDDENPVINDFVDPGLWIDYEFTAPVVSENTVVPIVIRVVDAAGRETSIVTNLGVTP